ncbi:CAMP factor pore-forming toxin Cfg [Streptococcus canis]|uniref:CAMP factor pore-forming toxin Cfg n=1 Tax=Streptococcus canis TaxID=1329 RepID=UPI0040365767
MKHKQLLYLSTVVAGLALFPTVGQSVFADNVSNPDAVLADNNQVTAQKDALIQKLDDSSKQLDAIKDEVKGTDAEATVDKAKDAVEHMKTSVRFSPDTIYDLNSIGVRVEALSEAIQAIVFSTTQLTNKVEQAHIDMGFAITKLVIRILDPFTSVDAIKAQVEELKVLKQKVLNYPDLQPTDRATIYTKAKLDKAIWNTRFERDKKVLGVKSFEVYNTLNKAITHAVGVQLNPTTTVEQVDQEIVALQNALATALQ